MKSNPTKHWKPQAKEWSHFHRKSDRNWLSSSDSYQVYWKPQISWDILCVYQREEPTTPNCVVWFPQMEEKSKDTIRMLRKFHPLTVLLGDIMQSSDGLFASCYLNTWELRSNQIRAGRERVSRSILSNARHHAQHFFFKIVGTGTFLSSLSRLDMDWLFYFCVLPRNEWFTFKQLQSIYVPQIRLISTHSEGNQVLNTCHQVKVW